MSRVLRRLCRGVRTRCRLQISLSQRETHTGGPSAHPFLWLSGGANEASVHNASLSRAPTAALGVPAQISAATTAVTTTTSSSSSRLSSVTPPLLMDPPFTPVPGEADALEQWRSRMEESTTALLLLYTCATCTSPLFCSTECTSTSAPGSHISGWPSFTAPVCTGALRLRSLLQRVAIERSGAAGESSGAPLHATLASRGLPAEGDMARQARGASCRRVVHRTWRETCLRDENKRSDPTVLEGCCAACGTGVCRVVPMQRGRVIKYVGNPTALVAKLAEEAEKRED